MPSLGSLLTSHGLWLRLVGGFNEYQRIIHTDSIEHELSPTFIHWMISWIFWKSLPGRSLDHGMIWWLCSVARFTLTLWKPSAAFATAQGIWCLVPLGPGAARPWLMGPTGRCFIRSSSNSNRVCIWRHLNAFECIWMEGIFCENHENPWDLRPINIIKFL